MRDEPKNSCPTAYSSQAAKSLARLAEALGVPVSNFHGQDGDTSPAACRVEPSDAAILAFLGAHLATINIERRKNFLAAVQAMVETPQGPTANEA